ncbi:hypothetical protein MAP00_006288 [Monascus purpureus]|nr:hypothetical protein MAP00_006288 [Monascus purpureus]
MALPQPLRRGFTSLSLPRSSRLLSTTTTTTTTKITQDAYSNGRIASTQPHTVDPRWLMIIKRRIGRCMMFGLKPHQVREAGEILRQLAWNWRELVAGSEGYLTDVKRRASFRHNVVWGEMVS